MVAASDRDAVAFSLSSGQAGDDPQGRKLLATLGGTSREVYLLMDKAYEGDATRNLAMAMGYIPVVPPKSNRKNPWEYDKSLYKKRNQIERLFRRIKRFRRIFTRCDKLDIMFLSFVFIALIVDALLYWLHPLVQYIQCAQFSINCPCNISTYAAVAASDNNPHSSS